MKKLNKNIENYNDLLREEKCIVLIPFWKKDEFDELELDGYDSKLWNVNNEQLKNLYQDLFNMVTTGGIFEYSLMPHVAITIYQSGGIIYQFDFVKKDLNSRIEKEKGLTENNVIKQIEYTSSFLVEYLNYEDILHWRFDKFYELLKDKKLFYKKNSLGMTYKEATEFGKYLKEHEDKIFDNTITQNELEKFIGEMKYKIVHTCNNAPWSIIDDFDGHLTNDKLETKDDKYTSGLIDKCKKARQNTRVVIFKDYQSLLIYELLIIAKKKIKRCDFCGKFLPRRISGKIFKGKSCPPNSKCCTEKERLKKQEQREKKK